MRSNGAKKTHDEGARGRRHEGPVAKGLVGAVAVALTVALALGSPVRLQASGGSPGAGGAGPGVELRPAREPSPGERARMLRWHERWRRQTAPLKRLLGRFGDDEAVAPVGDAEWCRSLAAALLALDRESVFPVPSYAADAHLRRAVRRLVLGATACLEGRLHEAVHRIRRAEDAFANAELVLRPYGVEP
ncbi:MAG: hypothetical protein PVG07_04710 [Acidobacteriota bacterium]